MTSGSKPHSSLWHVISITAVLLGLGCAQGGGAVATGPCAQAIGGPATIVVSPSLRISLGDEAITAASRAVGEYLTGLPGIIGESEKTKANAKAVEAAEKVKGATLKPDEKKELEDRAQVAVENYKAHCGK